MQGWLNNIFKSNRLEYEFLPFAVEIEETPHSPIHRIIVWTIAIMAFGIFLWAYLGKVDEVAVAKGRVIPEGHTRVIQPIEEGVIRAMHVNEGQSVKTGQVLIDLDPTFKEADVESADKAFALYMLDKEMRMSELDDQYGKALGSADLPEEYGRSKEVLHYQKRLREARDGEFKAREEALMLIISQKDNAIKAVIAIRIKLEKEVAILKEQAASYQYLYDDGVLSKSELLNKLKELYVKEQELEAQKMIVKQAEENFEEARKNLNAFLKEREKLILNDVIELEKKIVNIKGDVKKAKKSYEMQRLVSPVNGTIHELGSITVGTVVTPAQIVAKVVPDGIPLVIEANVTNNDIGFIKMGQEAEVKVNTFPFQKYGTIKGEIVFISPDSIENEKLGSVYIVKVKPLQNSLLVEGLEKPLSPGMTAIVEIKTGKRRIIEFFLSPIMKYAKESLTVR